MLYDTLSDLLRQHAADFKSLVDIKILADVLLKNELLTVHDIQCLQLPTTDESEKEDHIFVYHKMVGLGEEGYKKFLSCLVDPHARQHAGHIKLHKILSTSQQ